MRLDRRLWLAGTTGALGAAAWPALAREGSPPGVLRTAIDTVETGFDPPRISDGNSIIIASHIFESLLDYDPLAQPTQLVPRTAEALPEVLDGGRRFVFTVRRGIFFADDPAFGGQPRELVAQDYLYSLRRYADPALRSEHFHHFETAKVLGLAEVRQRALKSRQPFDYDAPVEGLRALDRYRLEIRLAEPAPRLPYLFASASLTGAVAREVVERYGEDIPAHPVGTGAYRLTQWRRASRIVLERNPGYREVRYAAEPAADDAAGQALLQRWKGRRLPFVDRLEFDVIEEDQPRWLAFLQGDLDVLRMPSSFLPQALPGGKLAPYLARRGVHARVDATPSIAHTYFNMDDPLVGGYRAEKVALRRAIALAYDNALENRHVYAGAHRQAFGMIAPGCYGFDETLRSELGSGNVARAKALLDLCGYVDRDGDGWREQPDGRPLVLRRGFSPDQRSRRVAEVWNRCMSAVGLRLEADVAPFAELIKRALAGQMMMWGYIWGIGQPDGDFSLGLAYGPNAEQSNDARFRLPAFDRLYAAQRVMPDGPERLKLMREATRLMLAYVPYLPHFNQSEVHLSQARVHGFVRHPFSTERFQAVELLNPGEAAGT